MQQLFYIKILPITYRRFYAVFLCNYYFQNDFDVSKKQYVLKEKF